jgi:hypothetical protein
MKFPTVTGSNLLRQKKTLPAAVLGNYNLLLIPFYQWQQMEVDTWIAFGQELEDTTTGVHFYELPTIQQRNIISQTFINEGMRAGIPNPDSRRRTITLYLDKVKFRQSLGLADENHIAVILIDPAGEIIWRESGNYSTDKASSLAGVLEHAMQTLSAI